MQSAAGLRTGTASGAKHDLLLYCCLTALALAREVVDTVNTKHAVRKADLLDATAGKAGKVKGKGQYKVWTSAAMLKASPGTQHLLICLFSCICIG